MIPDIVTGTICKGAVDAGHLDGDGTMPHCYGRKCSCFNQCNQAELTSMIEIEKLKKSALGRTVFARLAEGRK